LCDARTIKSGDLVAGETACSGWPEEPLGLGFSPTHRWYWFPQQSPQEATLVKVFDSVTQSRPVISTYTAFDNPGIVGDTAKGMIELRALVFW
jgi:hypothetical protein